MKLLGAVLLALLVPAAALIAWDLDHARRCVTCRYVDQLKRRKG